MTLDADDDLVRDIQAAYESRMDSSSQSVMGAAKSTSASLKHREEGNRSYSEKNFRKALISYTKSVATALQDSEEQCKAYDDRSVLLFEMKKYESCLLDINRVLKTHCRNVVLRQKLLNRKERYIGQIKLSAASIVNYDVPRIIDENGTNPAPDQEPVWRTDVLSQFGNPLLPNASPKIKLKYDTKWGRHFVATADINPGETLINEEFFVVVTPTSEGDTRFMFCNFCTKECHALIPCLSCSSILYCSEECRTMAYDKYHRMECHLTRIKSSPTLKKFMLSNPIAVRLFLVGTKQGAALENLMNNLSVSDIFEENYNFADKPFNCDYMAALRLKCDDSVSIFEKSLIKDAVEVITELRKLKFFKSVPDTRFREAEVFATALLLNNCRGRCTNRLTKIDEFNEKETFEGLLLLQNMMNHSCNPNVEIFRGKRENIMYSVRPIKKDEQLFCSYYRNFEYCPKPERIRGHIGFVCQCEACNEDWPPVCIFTDKSRLTSECILKTVEGLLMTEGHDVLYRQLVDISDPIAGVDTTVLINLEVREIVSVIAKILSLLYKIMKPMSFPVAICRGFLVMYSEYFYSERERDLSLSGKLKFLPVMRSTDMSKDLLSSLPVDAYHRETIMRIIQIIRRLKLYIERRNFVNKNIVR